MMSVPLQGLLHLTRSDGVLGLPTAINVCLSMRNLGTICAAHNHVLNSGSGSHSTNIIESLSKSSWQTLRPEVGQLFYLLCIYLRATCGGIDRPAVYEWSWGPFSPLAKHGLCTCLRVIAMRLLVKWLWLSVGEPSHRINCFLSQGPQHILGEWLPGGRSLRYFPAETFLGGEIGIAMSTWGKCMHQWCQANP